jgi:hypothetical protein
MKSFKPRRRRATTPGRGGPTAAGTPIESLVREVQANRAARAHGYRERSLALHGWICALCAREFEAENLHQLTVHHKDGNHDNNPPDGSNWENLCSYCHEAEHTKGMLGDYLTGRDRKR